MLRPPFFRGIDVYYYSQNGLPFERPSAIEYLPPRPTSNAFTALFAAGAAKRLPELLAQWPWDISPTSDDRPFFFDIWRYDRAETWRARHVITLRNLLLSVVGLSLLLIMLPLRRLRRASDSPNARGSADNKPMFFAGIGFGFVFLEIWLLHRFTTYLGHQVYSLSVVLATLLVTTGLGAAVGSRWFRSARVRALAGSIGAVMVCAVMVAALQPVMEATWQLSLPIRAGITVAFIAPLGLCLGQPFVGGLAWLREKNPSGVPWCIGVNGFCSVIGSIGVIPLLMAAGYSGSLIAGVTCYLLAALSARAMRSAS
jgi:hypothetical protein